MKRFLTIIIFVLIILSSFWLGQRSMIFSQKLFDLSIATQVWDVINTIYLRKESLDQEKIKYGLAKGIVNALGDQHSAFFDPEEAKIFLAALNGELEGIGAELKLKDGAVIIVSPLPNSPAEKAGLKPKDVILKIDGKFLGDVTDLFEVVMKIRGPKGTPITLTILHEGEAQPVDVTLIRDTIHVEAIRWEEKKIKDISVAILKLNSFTDIIDDEFQKTLKEIMEKNITHLILDLRFNGGGYLDGAVDVLSYFISPGETLVSIRGKTLETRAAEKKKFRYSGKIVVLVNDASASASEIVAGALQDYQLAKVIGVKTFGKGTVQEVVPFQDQSAMRITIAEWLTPKGRSIEEKGIEPDYIIELNYDEFKDGKDNQLDAAIESLTKS